MYEGNLENGEKETIVAEGLTEILKIKYTQFKNV